MIPWVFPDLGDLLPNAWSFFGGVIALLAGVFVSLLAISAAGSYLSGIFGGASHLTFGARDLELPKPSGFAGTVTTRFSESDTEPEIVHPLGSDRFLSDVVVSEEED